jgi:hypothetical protein
MMTIDAHGTSGLRNRTQDWTTSCVSDYAALKEALVTMPQVTDGKVSVSVCSGCDAWMM